MSFSQEDYVELLTKYQALVQVLGQVNEAKEKAEKRLAVIDESGVLEDYALCFLCEKRFVPLYDELSCGCKQKFFCLDCIEEDYLMNKVSEFTHKGQTIKIYYHANESMSRINCEECGN